MGGLHEPTPEALHPVARLGLVVRHGLDFLEAADEVHVLVLDHWCAEPEFRSDVEDREKNERKVVRDERVRLPVTLEEHGPARELSCEDET